LLVVLQAALDGTFDGLFDFVKDRDSLAVCQIGKVISTAVVVLDGESRKLITTEKK
jgi:hypothetical protein